MAVVRPPKKLRDLCAQLREHFEPELLPQAEAYPKFVAQVNAVLAQEAVFSCNWPDAARLCRASVLAADQWYSGNFLQENLAALTFVAIRTDERADAEAWLADWLETRLGSDDVPDHIRTMLIRQVEIQRLAMAGEATGLRTWAAPSDPQSLDALADQLLERRKGLSLDSPEGIRRLLFSIETAGTGEDFLAVYARGADDPALPAEHHITAARIQAAFGDADAARETILRWRRLGWWPVEATDILPMALFTYFDLYPLLSDEFLIELRDA